MAEKKKRTTDSTKTKKSGSASSTQNKTGKGKKTTKNTTKTTKQKTADFGAFHGEIIVIVSIVLMLFLFLSNFSICGKLGNMLSGVFFGIFGGIQYVLPVLVFLAISLLVSNAFSSLAIKKVILGAVSVISISAFWQLASGVELKTAVSGYQYASARHSGGGYIGTAISNFLSQYLGTVGAYLCMIAILLISIVLITEHSFLSLVKKGSNKVADNVKASSVVAKKNLEEIREQRRIQAQQRQEAKALLKEEGRKNLIKDPELYKKTMVLPEGSILPQSSPILSNKVPKKTNTIPEIRELHYDSSKMNFELEKMAKEEDERKKVAPNFHLLYEDEASQGGKDETEILVEQQHPQKEQESQVHLNREIEEPIVKEPVLENTSREEVQPEESSVSKTDWTKNQGRREEKRQEENVIEPTSNQNHGWNLDIDSLPTEEELLLNGPNTTRPSFMDDMPVKRAQKVRTTEEMTESSFEDSFSVEPKVEPRNEEGYSVSKAVPVREQQSSFVETKKTEPQREISNRQTKQIQPKQEVMEQPKKPYCFPPIDLLKAGDRGRNVDNRAELQATAEKLQQTLENFGVGVTITDVSQGPSVTRYELQPEQGVKVSKIVGLADDIKLNLAAADIRIEAPIPGKAAVGIEVPNKTNAIVTFRDLIENEEFKKYPSDIAFAVGKDIGGKTIVTDIAKMPHLLIAGATGSGKSVCINTLIMSILYKAKPSDVKLIMIDPKVVELSTYNGIPHLLIPVVTDPKKASSALNWAVMEMTDRYKKFAEVNVRNLKGYNQKVEEVLAQEDISENSDLQKLPQIVIIVDELADLMMVAPGEVEDAIVRLSQLARAAGIHLVIATQRPSVNVITGLIKANVPSRIAFSVSSGVDSRTILDMNGAEKLLGKGDMLFYPAGYQKPVRVQGAFISDDEVMNVVEFLKEQAKEAGIRNNTSEMEQKISHSMANGSASNSDRDEYFLDAARFIIEKEKASIGMLQRMFKIGFNRAARIMEQLSEAGIVGPEEGTKPRKVTMSMEELEQYIDEYL